MLARIRKAVMAGAGAGVGAAGALVAKATETGSVDANTGRQAFAAFLAAGAVVGWATWRVRNAPAA